MAIFYPESWSPGRSKMETVLEIRFLFLEKQGREVHTQGSVKEWPQWALILAPEFACPQNQLINIITNYWSFAVIGNKRCSAVALHSTQHEGEGGEKGWRMFVVVFVLWIFCLQGHSLCSAGQAQCKNHKKNLPWIKNEQLFKIPFSYSLGSMQHSKVTFQSKPQKFWHFIKCRAWPVQHLHGSLIN